MTELRRLCLLLVIAVTLILAGCGASRSTHPVVSSKPKPAIVQTVTPPLICQKTGPPCSAIIPQGGTLGNRLPETEAAFPRTVQPLQALGLKDFLPSLIGSAIYIDTAGVEFISQFENVYQSVYCPYWDPYGRVWSRAFGETDWSGNFGGRCITHAQAVGNLHSMVEGDYQWAIRDLGVNFNHHQIDALDSFVWNLGAYIFVNNPGLAYSVRHYDPYPLEGYDIAGGQVLEALRVRRIREVALFLKPEPRPTRPSRHQLEAELRAHKGVLTSVQHFRGLLIHDLVISHCVPNSRRSLCVEWVNQAYGAHKHEGVEYAFIKSIDKKLAHHEYSA